MNVDMFTFDELPVHDTCWSMIAGADGAVYAAACCEHTGGVGAFMVRFDAETDKLEYLFDVANAVGEPADNGRATQCKVHYSLLPTDDGLIYGTTHLSGPAVGQVCYPHWGGWNDKKRGYVGAMFFLYDLNARKIIDRGLMVPQEGSRTQALDEKRGRIYVIGYPLDHFMVYDIEKRELKDYGRLGSVNPQTIWVDPEGNGYTADDFGRILKFDAEKNKLIELSQRLPYPIYQSGWHSVPYDVVAGPDPWVVFGTTWNVFPHVFRYDMSDGPEGRVDDLGPAQPEYTGEEMGGTGGHHVGGFVLSTDGWIYYGANHILEEKRERGTHLVRLHPETCEIEDLGLMTHGEDHIVHYLSRGMCAANGDLVFAGIGHHPQRLYRFSPEGAVRKENPAVGLRKWG